MSRPRRRVAAAALLLLGGGCTVGPRFHRPDAPRLTAWRNDPVPDAAINQTTDPNPRWWAAFHDPVLTALIDIAIRNNLDVQQAVLRVVESRQGIVTARAAGLPTLNATGTYTRYQLGTRGILESDGVYRQLNELADQDPALVGAGARSAADRVLDPATEPFNLFQYGLSASWELDLFGRVRRSVEQARAQTAAQAEAANDALTSLESEVAQAYVSLRGAQALAASQDDNIRTASDSLALTENRQLHGLSSALDVDQARTQLLGLQRQLPEYEKQEQQAINRLDLLVGQVPGTLDAELRRAAPLPALPDAIGVGVPSALARRRPDIRQAEAQLHAATAEVGVSMANFYPDVALTGSLGLRATDASYLTSWASHFYQAGPSVSLPIFEGGRLTAGLRLARAQRAEAALHYRATVLNALREVEDALVAFRSDRMERDRLAGELAAAADTLTLATSRYAHGVGDYLSVLDAQRSTEDSRQGLVQADVALSDDVVGLYRALGGGWEAPGASSQAPQPPRAPPFTPAALDSLGAATH